MMRERITCGQARRIRWLHTTPRETSPAQIAAHDHESQCGQCQRFEHDMIALRDAVHDLPVTTAPIDVRNRIFASLAQARAAELQVRQERRVRRVRGAWFAAAGMLLAAAALTIASTLRSDSASSIAALTEDHARASGAARLESTDRGVVSRWIGGQVHFAMFVPELQGARIRGARVRLIDGRGARGVVVEYDVSGTPLSYFVTPIGSTSGGGEMRFEHHERDGYRVVIWRHAGLEHAMVGNLPDAQLVRLAQSCIDQSQTRVAAQQHQTAHRRMT